MTEVEKCSWTFHPKDFLRLTFFSSVSAFVRYTYYLHLRKQVFTLQIWFQARPLLDSLPSSFFTYAGSQILQQARSCGGTMQRRKEGRKKRSSETVGRSLVQASAGGLSSLGDPTVQALSLFLFLYFFFLFLYFLFPLSHTQEKKNAWCKKTFRLRIQAQYSV